MISYVRKEKDNKNETSLTTREGRVLELMEVWLLACNEKKKYKVGYVELMELQDHSNRKCL